MNNSNAIIPAWQPLPYQRLKGRFIVFWWRNNKGIGRWKFTLEQVEARVKDGLRTRLHDTVSARNAVLLPVNCATEQWPLTPGGFYAVLDEKNIIPTLTRMGIHNAAAIHQFVMASPLPRERADYSHSHYTIPA